jgi:hypothetical protein
VHAGISDAVAGDRVMPVGEELGMPVLLEDLRERRVVERPAPAVDPTDTVVERQSEAAVVVVGFGVAVGAVGVGELFPTGDTCRELLIGQRAGVPSWSPQRGFAPARPNAWAWATPIAPAARCSTTAGT